MIKKERLKRLLAALFVASCACNLHAGKPDVFCEEAPCQMTRTYDSAPVWQAPKNLDEAVCALEDYAKGSDDKAFADLVAQACTRLKTAKRSPSTAGWHMCAVAIQELAQWCALEYAPKRGQNDGHLNECSKTCAWISHELEECCQGIAELINEKFPCDSPRTILDVPVKINQAGKYCVTKDLEYNGTGTAIEILADNVTIDFNNHNLTLLNPAATGIGGQGYRELVIKQDSIWTPAPSADVNSNGIFLQNFEKVTIENCFFKNTRRGIRLNACRDVRISDCRFEDLFANNLGRGVFCTNTNTLLIERASASNVNIVVSAVLCTNCTINQLTATDCLRAFSIETSNNFQAYNISSKNQFQSNLFFGDDCIIENLAVSAAPTNPFSLLQLGSIGNRSAKNVVINNASLTAITNTNGTGGALSLLALNARNVEIQNSCFKSNASGYNFPAFEANVVVGGAVTFGAQPVPVENVVFTMCTFEGSGSTRNVETLDRGTKNIVFDTCSFDGATQDGFVAELNAVKVILKNNTVKNSLGNGIRLAGSTTRNTIQNNIVTNNAGTGITVEATSQAHSIVNNVASKNGTNYSISNASNSLDLNNVDFN